MFVPSQPEKRVVDVVNYCNAFKRPAAMQDEKTLAKPEGKDHSSSKKTYKSCEPRKRPLRTYGRAAAAPADQDAEQPPRKRRVIERTSDFEQEYSKENASLSPQLPKLPAAQTPAPPTAKKGSILAFFKPAVATPATSSSVLQSEVSSDHPDEGEAGFVSTPPSSPPLPRVSERKKRRLGTRAAATSSSPARVSREDPREPNEAELDEHEPKVSEEDQNTKARSKTKRRPAKATVQTTLALSMKDDPAFTICKDCEILYNPLNENDRKDHARRHAIAMRKKSEVVAAE